MKEYQTQLLVIGGGASGMSAAAAAAEKGIETIVAEAGPAVGGNGLFPRGIFGVNSVIQRRKLIFADRDQLFSDCMQYSHWKIDGRIIRALIDKSGDTISWLMEKGVEFCMWCIIFPTRRRKCFISRKRRKMWAARSSGC